MNDRSFYTMRAKKHMTYLFLPILLCIFYGSVAIRSGVGLIHPAAWLFVLVLFAAAFVMARGKWQGCILGLAVGITWICMGMQHTGQLISIEAPFGIVSCLFYLICGVTIFKANRK